MRVMCGKTGDEDDFFDPDDVDEERALFDVDGDGSSYPFYWSTTLQQSFREELEK